MAKTISSKNGKDPYIEILHRVLDEWVHCIDNWLIVECWIPSSIEWSFFTFYLTSLTAGPFFFSLSFSRTAIFIIGNFPFFKKATLEALGKNFEMRCLSSSPSSSYCLFLVTLLFIWNFILTKNAPRRFSCPCFYFLFFLLSRLKKQYLPPKPWGVNWRW